MFRDLCKRSGAPSGADGIKGVQAGSSKDADREYKRFFEL